MTAIDGRDFTPEELVGRKIRIEGPSDNLAGHSVLIKTDGVLVENAVRLELDIVPNQGITATVTLLVPPDYKRRGVILQEDVEVLFSAYTSRVKS